MTAPPPFLSLYERTVYPVEMVTSQLHLRMRVTMEICDYPGELQLDQNSARVTKQTATKSRIELRVSSRLQVFMMTAAVCAV